MKLFILQKDHTVLVYKMALTEVAPSSEILFSPLGAAGLRKFAGVLKMILLYENAHANMVLRHFETVHVF